MDLFAIVILIFSAILHEIAHGFVADRLGDPTARLMGRLTLNPIPHIDPFMSILLPVTLFIASGGQFIFAAAKPVPVDPFNLQDPKKDMALVSLAGPFTNIIIASLAALLFHLSPIFHIQLLRQVVDLNLLLAIFNLVPIPPLDGSKILAQFLPEKDAAAYLSLSNIGFIIIFLLFAFPIGGFSLWNILFPLISFGERLLGF